MPFKNKDGTLNWSLMANMVIVLGAVVPCFGFLILRGVVYYNLPDDFNKFKTEQRNFNHEMKADIESIMTAEQLKVSYGQSTNSSISAQALKGDAGLRQN